MARQSSKSNETLQQALAKIKVRMTLKAETAFWVGLLLQTVVVKVTDENIDRFPVDTAGVDGIHLFINEKFFISLDDDERLALILHELMHLVYMHPTRRGNRDPFLYNIACDIVINQWLSDKNYKLPQGGVLNRELAFDKNGNARTSEEIYTLLLEDLIKQEQQSNGSSDSDDDNSGDSSSDSNDKSSKQSNQKSSYKDDRTKEDILQGSKLSNDIKQPAKQHLDENGNPQEEQGSNNGDAADNAKNGDMPKELSSENIESDIKQKIKLGVSQMSREERNKLAGSVPASVGILITTLLEKPKLHWRVILQRFIQESTKDDYTWSTPNRNWLSHGMIMPSLEDNQGLQKIDFLLDTSSSVGDVEFNAYVRELSAVVRFCKITEIGVAQFNTDLVSYDVLKNFQDLKKLNFKGRGGTCIHSTLEHSMKNDSKAIIVFSDGYFDIPTKRPTKPVIWLIYDNPHFKPPYGQVIHFSP